MSKITLTFGLLAGILLAAFLVITTKLCANDTINLDNSELIGYGSMIIALSMIFFGIKSYRDNYQRGAIKFGKALRVGLLITSVASLIYAAAGEAYYQFDPQGQAALMEKYADHHLNKMRMEGASTAALEQKAEEMTALKEMNKNPIIRFGMTLVIILPVGIVITLISSAVLRKREFLSA